MHDADIATNSTNSTDLEAICKLWEPATHVFAITLPFWVLLLALWSRLIYFRQARHALEIHRMLAYIPAIEVLHGLLSILRAEAGLDPTTSGSEARLTSDLRDSGKATS